MFYLVEFREAPQNYTQEYMLIIAERLQSDLEGQIRDQCAEWRLSPRPGAFQSPRRHRTRRERRYYVAYCSLYSYITYPPNSLVIVVYFSSFFLLLFPSSLSRSLPLPSLPTLPLPLLPPVLHWFSSSPSNSAPPSPPVSISAVRNKAWRA